MKKFICTLLLFFALGITSGFSNPQEDPPEPGDPPPGLVAPIDDWIPAFIVLGLGLGIVLLKRKKASTI